MNTALTRGGTPRVLVLAPRGRDADVVSQVLLSHTMQPVPCATLAALVEQLADGADLALLTEEAMAANELPRLAAWVDGQPTWSDFPFIVLATRRVGRRPRTAVDALQNLGNVVLLERPLNAETLVSAASAALRGRSRQYAARRHLAAEEAARDAERAARVEAERAGRMKDEFLATLSHELRTPLSAILGWTHLLSRPDATAADVAKASSTIERNARAQARLIEDLLDVSRITSGNLQLERAPMRIGPVFDAVLLALKPSADSKPVQIRIDGDADGVEFDADAARIQQIVWNLVSNAIKFTPAGGCVHLRAAVEGERVRLDVRDDGAGISADFLPHVFERFRQEQSTSARSFGGLGLGLAIVRQLVELHGGAVEARSDGAGLGAVFTVWLPLCRAGVAGPTVPAVAAARAPVRIGTDSLAGLHVVVVEDEADGREMLARLLEREGARVTAVSSADEALAELRRHTPDLLISDIGMPRVDGHELMQRVCAEPDADLRRLPAIAVTAFAREEDAAKASAAGYRRHVAKPIDPEALLSAIAELQLGRPPACLESGGAPAQP